MIAHDLDQSQYYAKLDSKKLNFEISEDEYKY
jgi:hypothetical protein